MRFKQFLFFLFLSQFLFSNNKINLNNVQLFRINNISPNSIEVEFSINELILSEIQINQQSFTNISLLNSYPSKQLGLPNLPMVNNLIEIPQDDNFRIEIINDEIEIINGNKNNINFLIDPVQGSQAKSKYQNKFEFNEKEYASNKFIKNPLIEIKNKGKLREVNIANLMISPLEYNPVTNEVIVHKNIKFKIYFDNLEFEQYNQNKSKAFSYFFEPIFRNSLKNYSSVNEATRENDFIEDKVGYIIIADRIFENSLETFINWKTKKGFHVTVGYTDEIGSSSNQIKNYLQNKYENPLNGEPIPSFVLLVGDTQQIPASYSSGGHVSDLDYCDYTNDNLPDVLCGRFSAQNPNHALAQVEKTLEYEQFNMPNPSFLGEVLMISGVDANFAPTYGNGQINYGNQYYFNSNNGINSNTFLYPASGNSQNQILNIANQGVGFINYTAHGWESGWADPEFDLNDASNMTNFNQYPTMIGNCCLTNAFDTGSCFGETLLRKANAGAIGYIGGSDVTYWDEDYWWGVGSGNVSVNPSYNTSGIGAYDAMFHLQNEDTWAVVNSAIMMVGNLAVAQANGMDDYYWEIYHLMGDPSLSTYQGIPEEINANYDLFLPIGSEAIEIQADPFSYVGLSQSNELISSGTVDESGFVVLIFDPINDVTNLDITITGQNKIPHFNEIFVASPDGAFTSISSQNIDMGEDLMISQNEIINVLLNLENIGNANDNNIQVNLINTDNNQYINMITENINIDNLSAGENIDVILSFLIDQNAPFGHNFTLDVEVISTNNSWDNTYYFNIEYLIEDFNHNSFNEFPWVLNSEQNWEIINGNQLINESSHIKSGQIDHNMISEISIEMNIEEDGNIQFDKKVSCEDVGSQTGNFYDYLAFYIDNIEQEKWAGEINWSTNVFPVSAGLHTFTWKYIKDQAVTVGEDAAYIDNIIFPPSFYSSILYGDVNNDGNINIQDVILSVNIILGSNTYNESADINTDGFIDVLDIINIVNLILN